MFDEMGIVDGNLRRQKIDQSPYLFHFKKGIIEEAGHAMYSTRSVFTGKRLFTL